jgi:hypothetical protein
MRCKFVGGIRRVTRILAPASVLIAIVLTITGFATPALVMLFLGGTLLVGGLAVRVISPGKQRSRSGSLPYLLIAIIYAIGALIGLAIVVLVITHHVTSGAAFQIALGSLAFVVCSVVGSMFFVAWFQIRKNSAGQQA